MTKKTMKKCALDITKKSNTKSVMCNDCP